MSETNRIDTGCEDDYLLSGTAHAAMKELESMPPSTLGNFVQAFNAFSPPTQADLKKLATTMTWSDQFDRLKLMAKGRRAIWRPEEQKANQAAVKAILAENERMRNMLYRFGQVIRKEFSR